MVAREDHNRHYDGKGQPQSQQNQADSGPAALGHGSVAVEREQTSGQEDKGARDTEERTDGQRRGQRLTVGERK